MYKVREDYRSYEAPSRARTASRDKDELWGRLSYSNTSVAPERHMPRREERRSYDYGMERSYGREYERDYDRERDFGRSYGREERYINSPRRESYGDDLPVGGNFDSYTRESAMPRIRQSVKKSRAKVPAKYKALAIVYSVIIVAIMTLVLINTIPNVSAAGAATTQAYELPADALDKAITTSGVAQLESIEKNNGYTYDTSTNGFDKLCDWMENLVG